MSAPTAHEYRNQHTVPQAYLRGFANSERKLWCHDLKEGHTTARSVKRVASEDDFYTLKTNDGASLAWEQDIFRPIENAAPPAFAKLVRSEPLTKSDREAIAIWISVQIFRTTKVREYGQELLHIKLAEFLARPGAPKATPGFVERMVAANQHIVKNQQLVTLAKAFMPLSADILTRGWGIVRFDDRSLITSDNPVAPYREAPTVGNQDAPLYLLPVDSTTGLIVAEIGRLGFEIVGTPALASMFNERVAQAAHRYLFHDRDDSVDRYLKWVDRPAKSA